MLAASTCRDFSWEYMPISTSILLHLSNKAWPNITGCFALMTIHGGRWVGCCSKNSTHFTCTGKLPSTLIGWRRSTARPITRDFTPSGPAWITPLQRLDHFDTIQVLRNGPLRYTIYALRILCAHGLNDDALQYVFRSVVVARLLYAASAWHGLTGSSDRRRINVLLHRARRQGYCPPDLHTFEELCDSADDELFGKAVRLSNHILHDLLPPPSYIASQHYNLRRRTHSLQLPEHSTYLSDCNFFYSYIV